MTIEQQENDKKSFNCQIHHRITTANGSVAHAEDDIFRIRSRGQSSLMNALATQTLLERTGMVRRVRVLNQIGLVYAT